MTPRTKSKKSKRSSAVPFTSPLTAAHQAITTQKEESNDPEEEQEETEWTPEERQAYYERRDAKRIKLKEEAEEEKRLTSLLFGGGGTGAAAAAWHDEDDEEEDPVKVRKDAPQSNGTLFQIDRTGIYDSNQEKQDDNEEEEEPLASAWNSGDDDDGNEEENGNKSIPNDDNEDEPKAAWVDEDDENLNVSLTTKADRVKKLRNNLQENVIDGADYERRLRERFQATTSATARTDWAEVDVTELQKRQHKEEEDDEAKSDQNEDDEEEDAATKMLSSTAPLLMSSSTRLPANIIDILRKPDANASNYSNCTIQAVEFHPGSDEDEPLLLTAGLDKTLRFFKVEEDGEKSSKIHGIHFPNLPIHSASFLGDSGSVVVSGRRPFFYIYDAVAGKVRISSK